ARDGLLVARLHQPHVRDAVGRLVPEPPEIVALTRLLDLDHVGAQLAEQSAAEGRGHEGREIEDDETVQRSAHRISWGDGRFGAGRRGVTIAQMPAGYHPGCRGRSAVLHECA